MARDTTPTDYYGFDRPEVSAEWATSWSELLEAADTDLLRSGVIADRPTSAPDGAWWFATDTGELTQYDATDTAWRRRGGHGSHIAVNDGSDLQEAVASYDLIRIDGSVDVSRESPIRIGDDTVLYGMGIMRNAASGDTDLLLDDSTEATLEVTGNGVHLFGFAVANQNDEGTGVWCTGYSPNLQSMEIEAGDTGVRFGDSSTATTQTEPRIEFCRIYSQAQGTEGDGAIGIHVENMHDAKIYNNIIGGYDIGIQVDRAETEIIGNHTYAYPRTDTYMTAGIIINAQRVRCTHNRVEDGIMDAGIRLDSWFGDVSLIANRISVWGDTAAGIRLSTDDPSYHNWVITHNSLGSDWDSDADDYRTCGTAIDLNGVNTLNSIIGPNSIERDSYTSLGDTTTQDESPVASDHMPGTIIRDTDDGSIWYHTGDTLIEIGSR